MRKGEKGGNEAGRNGGKEGMRKGAMEERRERGREDYEGRKERQSALKRDFCHWYIGKKFTSSNLFMVILYCLLFHKVQKILYMYMALDFQFLYIFSLC